MIVTRIKIQGAINVDRDNIFLLLEQCFKFESYACKLSTIMRVLHFDILILVQNMN